MHEYDEIAEMSLAAIRKLNSAGIKCTVLTKGILPEALSKMSSDNEYGITLVSLDEGYRERVEPGAAPILDRLSALRRLHDLGCKTWVSVEPYPTPNIISQSLDDLLEKISFVDKIIFGRTNYSKEASSYPKCKDFYNETAQRVIEFCLDKGICYHIKEGTVTPNAGAVLQI
jgi:DNA repair photolyase